MINLALHRWSAFEVEVHSYCLFQHLTVVILYNNINSQLDATTTNFIDNYNQLNMFRAIISPIPRNTRLCLQLVVQYNAPAMLPVKPAQHVSGDNFAHPQEH